MSGARVFDAAIAPKITTLIATVGFYQHSGDWLYTSGLPAKSGVGGGVLGVLPGDGCGCLRSPARRSRQLSQGQAALLKMMEILGLGIMDGRRVTIVK